MLTLSQLYDVIKSVRHFQPLEEKGQDSDVDKVEGKLEKEIVDQCESCPHIYWVVMQDFENHTTYSQEK